MHDAANYDHNKYIVNIIILPPVTRRNNSFVGICLSVRVRVCVPNTINFKGNEVESLFLVFMYILRGYGPSLCIKIHAFAGDLPYIKKQPCFFRCNFYLFCSPKYLGLCYYSLLVICPIAIAHSMGQTKSVCVSLSV